MKRHQMAAVLLGLLVLPASALSTERHTDPSLHYGFEVPEGWVRIPDDVLSEAVASLVEQTGIRQRLDYRAAFQLESEYYFTYPYLMIQHHAVDSATIRQISSAMSSALSSQAAREDLQKLADAGIARGVSMGEPVVDPERRIVLQSIESEVEGVGPIKALSVMAPGRDGMVQLHFYSEAEDYNKYLPVFSSVVDTLEFEPGHSYSWTAAVAKSPGTSRLLQRALIGALMGALVALWALRRRQKNQE